MEAEFENLVQYAEQNDLILDVIAGLYGNGQLASTIDAPHQSYRAPIFTKITKFTFDEGALKSEIETRSKWIVGKIEKENWTFAPTNKPFDIYLKTLYGRGYNATDDDIFNYHLAVFAKSWDLARLFTEWINAKSLRGPNKYRGRIYEWSSVNSKWRITCKLYSAMKRSELYGLEPYFRDLDKDVDILNDVPDILRRLGVMSGNNYLLYGPPGTGKTSLVKTFAVEKNFPIFCLKMETVKPSDLGKALNPPDDISPIKVVLIEDFDRYITGKMGRETVSELLNALDGIFSGYQVIRFFSANHPELIVKDSALKTRFRRMWYFSNPTADMIESYLLKTLPTKEHSEIYHKFAIKAFEHHLTFRTVALFLSRFATEEDMILAAYQHIDQWIEELEHPEKVTNIGEMAGK
jgi:hypothetical protein